MTYIILTKKYHYMLERWDIPQFKYLGRIMTAICFIIELICFLHDGLPREGLVLIQMFPNLDIGNTQRGIIEVRRNEKENTITYRRRLANWIY